MDQQQILNKIDRIKEIPTLPTIVFELNKYLRDPDTSIIAVVINMFRLSYSLTSTRVVCNSLILL
jgi:HD-like signal output (HDOD) protein